MPNYLLNYHGGAGMEVDPAEMERVMGLWGAWYAELGDTIVDGGAPTSLAKTIAADGSVSDGGGANPSTGYTVITASDIDAAVNAAKGCPIRESGGSIEVCELIDMTPPE